MKKLLTSISILMLCSITAFSQEKKDLEQKSGSKTLEFLSKDGAFLKKEFYDLDKVSRIECQVLIISDVVKGQSLGCLKLTTTYYSSYTSSPDEYTGTLDYDELDACIKSFDYLQTVLLPTSPTVYTEAIYRTRDGVSIGAYYSSKSKWVFFIQTKSYSANSMSSISSQDISILIENFKKAKALIAEKTVKK